MFARCIDELIVKRANDHCEGSQLQHLYGCLAPSDENVAFSFTKFINTLPWLYSDWGSAAWTDEIKEFVQEYRHVITLSNMQN